MNELYPQLSILLLIIVRVTTFFVAVPLFSYKTIPVQSKVIISIALAWAMYYTFPSAELAIDSTYLLLVLKEAIVGLSLGLVGYIIISAVQVAGGLIDFQMGFAMANVIDPQTGANSPLMGQFFNFLALMLLLAINGHHMILDGIYYSYQFIAYDKLWPNFGNEMSAEFIAKLFAQVFVIAFQMAAPVVATLFLVTLALGITGKTVPQLNIFVIGFPIKIAVGFIVLIITMAMLIQSMQHLLQLIMYSLRDFMEILGGG